MPGKILAQFINNPVHQVVMSKIENQIELFNIIINTDKDHPALKKFLKSSGLTPII
jgi:hypothetical protein